MRQSILAGRLVLPALLTAALLACNDQGSTAPGTNISAAVLPGPGGLTITQFQLCKKGSSATFNVSVALHTGGTATSTASLNDGDCVVLWTNNAPNDVVTVTEQSQTGIVLDSIVRIRGFQNFSGGPIVVDTSVFAGPSVSGNAGHEFGTVVTFYNRVLPPPPVGCTFTQGYWKNHTNVWPAPYSPGAPFFGSGQTWLQNFNTPPKGNAYYNLSHQYMAAVLNGANGASAPAAVQAAIATSTAYFNNPSGSTLTRQDLIDLSDTLDNYNNGLGGVPHC